MAHTRTVAVIGAMDCEVNAYLALLDRVQENHYCGMTGYDGFRGSTRVIVAKSGIGKVNAARCTQWLIDAFHPDVLINAGIAGALGKGLTIGDIVVADSLIQHDFDARGWGYAQGNLCDRSDPSHPTVFYPDRNVTERMKEAVREQAAGHQCRVGRIVSGDVFIASKEKKTELRELFDAEAGEMEGAAIAQTAEKAGVPYAIVRVLSDNGEGEAGELIDSFEEVTAEQSGRVLKVFLDLLERDH
ncbi:MAG: 5'-methylthioadenosine/adenosylhomocysteine nucleosidase [Clostridia bacterium]|nr:5'-methylthioadenosine/adenosylhomocysteine nucleosidase [Clostridia bacterium]